MVNVQVKNAALRSSRGLDACIHVDSAAILIGTSPVAPHLTICRRGISGEFVYSLIHCVMVIRDDEVWDEAKIDYYQYLGDIFDE